MLKRKTSHKDFRCPCSFLFSHHKFSCNLFILESLPKPLLNIFAVYNMLACQNLMQIAIYNIIRIFLFFSFHFFLTQIGQERWWYAFILKPIFYEDHKKERIQPRGITSFFYDNVCNVYKVNMFIKSTCSVLAPTWKIPKKRSSKSHRPRYSNHK